MTYPLISFLPQCYLSGRYTALTSDYDCCSGHFTIHVLRVYCPYLEDLLPTIAV